MGKKLANPKGKDCYAYWGDTLTTSLAEDLSQGNKVNDRGARFDLPVNLFCISCTLLAGEEDTGELRFTGVL